MWSRRPNSTSTIAYGLGGMFAKLSNSAKLSICELHANSRPSVAAALAMTIVGLVYGAFAQDDGARPPAQFFDIPPQPLSSALRAFGQTAGVQVLYESSSATGRRSAAVRGSFSPDSALAHMLAGTDLEVRYIRPNAITIAPVSAAGGLPPAHPLGAADMALEPLRVNAPADDGDRARRDYSTTVQSDIEAALRRNAKTRAGDYRFGIRLWVDSSRVVQRTEMVQSTGDRNRDEAVSATLRGLVISRQAPNNTPSPVHVVVVVRSLR